MPLRVHDFSGTNPNPVAQYDAGDPMGDDEGAPPVMPPGARVTKVGGDGEIVADASPQSEADLAIERAKAAAKLAAGRKPRAAQKISKYEIVPDPNEARALRARCLEIAARGNEDSAEDVIAAARALLAFVENG